MKTQKVRRVAFAMILLSITAHARQFPSPSVLPGAAAIEDVTLSANSPSAYFGQQLNAVGDLNGDGRVDFAIGVPEYSPPPGNTSQDRGACYVLFGSPEWAGETSFSATPLDGQRGFVILGEVFGDNLGSRVVGAGDINGDGYDDLAVSAPNHLVAGSNRRGCVYVLFGAANLGAGGTIGAATIAGSAGFRIYPPKWDEPSTADVPEIAGVGDIDGDGFDDLAISSPSFGQTAEVIPLGQNETRAIAAGDIDADGLGDFVVAQRDAQRVLVFSNQGSSFSVSTLALPYPTAVRLADLNADGRADLIVTSGSLGPRVLVYLSVPGGGLAPGSTIAPIFGDISLDLGDFDGDGDLDIVVGATDGNNGPGTLHFFDNDGAGAFTAGQTVQIVNDPIAIAAGDVDGDGDVDLVLEVDYNGLLHFLANDGAGHFAASVASSDGYSTRGLTLADLDQDGDLDALRWTLSGLRLAKCVQGGVYLPTTSLEGASSMQSVIVDDVDADGDLDILRTASGSGFGLRLNLGNATFRPLELLDQDGLEAFGLALTDLDGDGDRDVAFAARIPFGDWRVCIVRSFGDSTFSGTDSGLVAVLRGSPTVHLAAPYDMNSTTSNSWITMSGRHGNERLGSSLSACGDLDGDGLADFAVGATGGIGPGLAFAGCHYVVRGSPTLSTAAFVDLHALSGPDGFVIGNTPNDSVLGALPVQAADFDGDSQSDLIAPYAGGALVLFGSPTMGAAGLESLNNPDGTRLFQIFTAQPGDQAGLHPIAAGDVNGDGRADVLIGAPAYGEGLLLRGAVFGVFGAPRPLSPPLFSMAGMTEARGFRMLGSAANQRIAQSLAAVGDVDGDGIGDFAVGDVRAANFAGRVYLVLGQRYGPPLSYCTAQTNSMGCIPVIGWAGDLASISDPDAFHILSQNLLNQKSGLLFYGISGRASAPYLGGVLCALPPLRRTFIQSTGGSLTGSDCTGAFDFDWSAWMASGSDTSLLAGVTVNSQFWSRDPNVPARSNLSAALEFSIGP